MTSTDRWGTECRRIVCTCAAVLVVAALLAACGGGGSGDADAAASAEDTSAIDTATAATSAPAPAAPTATPPATATAVPTPAAVPTPDPTAAVIAAWERYLRLSIEARGADPSPEALDFDSYVGGDAKAALLQSIADGEAAGTYIEGSVVSLEPQVSVRSDGDALVSDCVEIDLQARLDGSLDALEQETGLRELDARQTIRRGVWIIVAAEMGAPCDVS